MKKSLSAAESSALGAGASVVSLILGGKLETTAITNNEKKTGQQSIHKNNQPQTERVPFLLFAPSHTTNKLQQISSRRNLATPEQVGTCDLRYRHFTEPTWVEHTPTLDKCRGRCLYDEEVIVMVFGMWGLVVFQ